MASTKLPPQSPPSPEGREAVEQRVAAVAARQAGAGGDQAKSDRSAGAGGAVGTASEERVVVATEAARTGAVGMSADGPARQPTQVGTDGRRRTAATDLPGEGVRDDAAGRATEQVTEQAADTRWERGRFFFDDDDWF